VTFTASAPSPPNLTEALARELFEAARGTVPAWSKCEWCGTALVAGSTAGNGPDWLALAPVQVWFAPDPEDDDSDDETRAMWSLPRFGTALLVREGREWRPTGRVLFNIAPANAPERLGAAWRLVGV
jgi:hypothetical protein